VLNPVGGEFGDTNNDEKGKNMNNHLANETSPYLLEHASNPIDWYPWVEEAFAKAKRENKPIFLSIGYSTDSFWLVPHFEKMLYDQALLAIVYTEAYQATKKRSILKLPMKYWTMFCGI
jgi:uncharacterized protein YyaL (SSP411 family)